MAVNALSSALSSIRTIELQMAASSANIANADVTGYTRKTETVQARVSGGQATGVMATGLTSSVDAALVKQIVSALADDGAASTTNDYATSLNSLMSSLSSSGSTDLSSMLSTLQSSLSSLATTPESTTLKAQVLSNLDTIAGALRSTSSGIQDLREKADAAISSTITGVNSALKTIDDLNDQIVSAKAAGRSTADLEDQRMQALQTVASAVGVNYFVDNTGRMKIYTTSGQTLLDTVVHTLSHTTAAAISSSVSYTPGSSSGLDGVKLDGVDITSSLTSGTLGSLITLRDSTLPAVQTSLDNLAATLSSTLNDLYNQGSSTNAPDTLTGTATVSAGDGVSASGTLRIALVKSDGTVDTSTDIDLSTVSSVSDILSTLNSMSGISATITGDGHLSISSTVSGEGIALNEMDSAVGANSQGFSSYFGLNDLLVGGTSAATIAVRSDLTSNPALFAAGTLSSSSTLASGDVAVASGDASIASSLQSALSGTVAFGASGILSASTTSFATYAGNIISTVGANATQASSAATVRSSTLTTLQSTFSAQSGVNIDEETATLAQLQNAYAASAKIISILQATFQSLLTAVQT